MKKKAPSKEVPAKRKKHLTKPALEGMTVESPTGQAADVADAINAEASPAMATSPTTDTLEAKVSTLAEVVATLTHQITRMAAQTDATSPFRMSGGKTPTAESPGPVPSALVMDLTEEVSRPLPFLNGHTTSPMSAGVTMLTAPEWVNERMSKADMQKFSLKYTQYRRAGGHLTPDQCLTKGFRERLARAWREFVKGTQEMEWGAALAALARGHTKEGNPYDVEDWFQTLELVIHLEESGGRVTREDSFQTLVIHRDPHSWLIELETFIEACERNFRTTNLVEDKIKDQLIRAVSQASLTKARALSQEAITEISARTLCDKIADEIFEENRVIKILKTVEFNKLPGSRVKREPDALNGDIKRHRQDDGSRHSGHKRPDPAADNRSKDHHNDRRHDNRYREDRRHDDRRPDDRRTEDRRIDNRHNGPYRRDERTSDHRRDPSWDGVYRPTSYPPSAPKQTETPAPRGGEESRKSDSKNADRRQQKA